MSDNRNYVAAWQDYKSDTVVVLERDDAGHLYKKVYNCPYYFYIPDENGEFTTIFDDKVKRVEFADKESFDEARRLHPVKFESDFRPLQRILMNTYYNRPTPTVNFAFLDIEVDYKQSVGFAGPKNPYGIINAVTIYQSWTGKFITLAVPPDVETADGKVIKWDKIPNNSIDSIYEKLEELIDAGQLRATHIPEIILCENEAELLVTMLGLLKEADIMSGWNSEFYDIPYIAERLLILGGEHMLAKLDHPGVRLPRKEQVDKFGTPEIIYKFTGKSHLDYMKLFQKFTFEGRTSYSLGNILQEEVGIGKLEFSGSLEQLYKTEFALFCAYNFRDVDGLLQLNDKFNFIQLANQMAHENTVLFDAVLGTVSYVETGIANHAFHVMKRIVNDKVITDSDKVEGAIVMTPRIGLHANVGSVDLKSLYPNTIRMLNASPEKIIGQFADFETDWRAIRFGGETKHVLILESGEQVSKTATEWKHVLKELKWAISAYGTVFDQGKGRGVIPDILRFWYTERKRLQGELKKWTKTYNELSDGPEKDHAAKMMEDFDLLQLTKKISMNSLYGALLNAAFRFGDQRLGASTTATGRQITTHMIETIGELLTGVRHPLLKRYRIEDEDEADDDYFIPKSSDIYANEHSWNRFVKLPTSGILGVHSAQYGIESDAIIYGDTDSCYFKTYGTTREEAVEIADRVADITNASFPQFVREAFNCQEEYDQMIGASREIVGSNGLFLAKKKYVIKVFNQDGFAVDKMKSMGSEIKKADTPKVIQQFLKQTVDMILSNVSYDEVAAFVNRQRKTVLKNKLNMFSLGVAKQVNNLSKYLAEYLKPGTHASLDKNGKMRNLTIPGHARAACNYNAALDMFDPGAKPISSGDKALVFYLRPNAYKFNSLAFPAEMTKFPDWFNEHFEVDIAKTEDKMFDAKLSGIFNALGKEVPTPQSVYTNKILGF